MSLTATKSIEKKATNHKGTKLNIATGCDMNCAICAMADITGIDENGLKYEYLLDCIN